MKHALYTITHHRDNICNSNSYLLMSR